MSNRLLGLDATRVWLAAKSCVAMLIGYALALRFEWNASSVATTIIVLQTAAVGTTLNKAALRLMGTLSGAVVGLAIVALCAHDRELFVLVMALLTGVCVWAAQSSAHQYAWLLLLLTSGVVAWPSAMAPLSAFQTSVDRVTAVVVGVILSSLAQAVFWPSTAAERFERTMQDIVVGCRDLLKAARREIIETEADPVAAQKLATHIVSQASSLETTLQAACVESRRFRHHVAGFRRVRDQLLELSLAAVAVGDASSECRRSLDASVIRQVSWLPDAFDKLDAACLAMLDQLPTRGEGTGRPIRIERTIGHGQPTDASDRDRTASESGEAPAISLLRSRITAFPKQAVEVCFSLANAEASSKSDVTPSTARPAPKAPGSRWAKACLASLQVVLAASFFLSLAWPLGIESAMSLVMIFAFMNAQLPLALAAHTILWSVASALPVGAVFYFLIMPGTDSLLQLTPWLALLFLPCLYWIASHNPLTSMSALLSLIITKALISVSTSPPSYDFVSFANVYLSLVGGFSVILFLAYLFETRSPRRQFRKLSAGVLNQSAEYLRASAIPPPGAATEEPSFQSQRNRLLRNLTQLRKLAASVDDSPGPQVDRQQVETLLQAFETLVMRLAGADLFATVSAGAERDERSIKSTHDWCVESLATAGRGLATHKLVEQQQPPEELLEGLRHAASGAPSDTSRAEAETGIAVSALVAYYDSLVDAILDCQKKVSQFDWERWGWIRF